MATLSIFVEPLTREFGWSRAALSGAVSVAGVLAALIAPLVGPLLDRHGSRLVLCGAVLVNATVLVLLSFTPSLLIFYLLFCIGRMSWAVPFDLGIYGAISNWFVERRAFAAAAATMAQMAGLVAMPLIAQFAIEHDSWRSGCRARRGHPARRLPAVLALSRATTGGHRPIAGEDSARARRAAILARAGDAPACVLAAPRLHRPRLPGAGRREPAPGAAPGRARHRRQHRGAH